MADKSYYQSEFTGEQIDAAIGIIISGNVDQAAQIATEQANRATEEADRAEFAADRAEQMGGKTSYIGDNGNWFEWDYATGEYVDSGTPARGEKGDTGAAGVVDYNIVNQMLEVSHPLPLPINKGGTNSTSAAAALIALGAAKAVTGSLTVNVVRNEELNHFAGAFTINHGIGRKPAFLTLSGGIPGNDKNVVFFDQMGRYLLTPGHKFGYALGLNTDYSSPIVFDENTVTVNWKISGSDSQNTTQTITYAVIG